MSCMKLPDHLWPFGNDRALGDESGGRIRNLQIGTIYHVVIATRDALGVGRRSQTGDFDPAANQRRKGFRITSGLYKAKIPSRFHAVTPQRLNREVM